MNKKKRVTNLKNDILKPVANRIKERKDSLINLRRFASNLGFEGWLKVEVIAALNDKIMDVKNTHSDGVKKNSLLAFVLLNRIDLRKDAHHKFIQEVINLNLR